MHFSNVTILERFSKHANRLRGYFDEVYTNPRRSNRERFVWDMWCVPGQYAHLRTPAADFFPKKLYQPFVDELQTFGQNQLGCHSLSNPWLSLYLEGHHQNLHKDAPHGPWAYVYSLTKSRSLNGGETVILKPDTKLPNDRKRKTSARMLNEYGQPSAKILKSTLKRIRPTFNRLTLFDPSLPHFVSPVRGTFDPRQGRLVIHGWFVMPQPFVVGPLKFILDAQTVNQNIDFLFSPEMKLPTSGIVTLKFLIHKSGVVKRTEVLTNTTTFLGSSSFVKHILANAQTTKWPAANAGSSLVLPLVFGTPT
jgi:hypothetical protein